MVPPRSGRPRSTYTRRRLLRLGAGAAFLGPAILAGCGTGEDGAGTEVPADEPPVLAADTGGQQYRRGGQLTLGVTGGTLAEAVLPYMYSTLVSVDRRSGAVYGDLADSVETDGDLALVFTLREEIRFHPDAQQLAGALTSADVKREFMDRAV